MDDGRKVEAIAEAEVEVVVAVADNMRVDTLARAVYRTMLRRAQPPVAEVAVVDPRRL